MNENLIKVAEKCTKLIEHYEKYWKISKNLAKMGENWGKIWKRSTKIIENPVKSVDNRSKEMGKC